MTHYIVSECTQASCRLRFPHAVADTPAACPRCGGVLIVAAQFVAGGTSAAPPPPARCVVALLDNIRSTHNVGSMLRTADGAGLAAVHLCGTTATPDHPRVAKTALGAERHVAWRYHPNALVAAEALRAAGFALIALEVTADAQPLTARDDWPPALALIVGNELAGIDPALLALADRVVALPMRGRKESLNVAVAFGVACYALTR